MKKLALFLLLLFAAPAAAVDLTITAANVVIVNGSPETGIANEVITAGQVVYRDPATSKVRKADSATSVDSANAVGIATNGAAANQPISFLSSGDVTIGATVTVGTTYILSNTAGGIAPAADLATGRRLTYVGYATSATVLRLMVKPTGVVAP